MYLVVSIEINTCEKHFVFSGLEDDPWNLDLSSSKHLVWNTVSRLGSVSLSYKDTFITETVPLWCSVQLRFGSVPAFGKPSSLRKNPAALVVGVYNSPRICSSVWASRMCIWE